MKYKFKLNDQVYKTSGYSYNGWIRMRGITIQGKERYVVENWTKPPCTYISGNEHKDDSYRFNHELGERQKRENGVWVPG